MVSLARVIDVRRLMVLRELDRTGTVSAAAAALHLTPSAVSQQLAALARETGETLLEPDGRRVRLTSAARLLAGHADDLVARLESIESDLAKHKRGELGSVSVASFATGISGLVVPAMTLLAGRCPELQVQALELSEEASLARLRGHAVDVVLAVEYPGRPMELERGLTRTVLAEDVLDVALPADHPLAQRELVELGGLADQYWITGVPGSPCREIVLAGCAHAGFQPEVRHYTEDWSAVMHLVAARQGITMVPRFARLTTPPGVVIRPLAGESVHRVITQVTRSGSEGAPHRAALLAALADVVAGGTVTT